MTKQQLFGICYVSVWVVLWGTIGSLIDLPFLNADIYTQGSFGQLLTFGLTAIISITIGVLLYPKVLNSRIFVAALGLDTDVDD
jgi:uncharacterized membrane protein